MAQEKTEFRNASGGVIGVNVIEPGGKEVALPLNPDETIWLSEEDRIATANSHKRDEDNPFANGHLVMVTAAGAIKNRRPIGDEQTPEADEQRQRAMEAAKQKEAEDEAQRKEEEARLEAGKEAATAPKPPAPEPKPSQPRQSPEETAAPRQAQGKAAQGSRAAGEEVATPGAVPTS